MRPSNPDLHMPEVVEASTTIVTFEGGRCTPGKRLVPSEVPVNLVYGGVPFAVMMATPSDLEDFAIGFSLTEGIIKSSRDIRSIEVQAEERGLRLCVDLTAERLHKHLARKRALSGRTGCGLCGIDDLAAMPNAHPVEGAAPRISIGAIHHALAQLEQEQPLNEITRAVHAAAWADFHGRLLTVREDVGRHNALDKLIGALCRDNTQPDQGFVLVTSRCSFELVEKVAAFGARTLVAISVPTSLAIERAKHLDITLVGVARHDSMTIFHGLERVRAQDV